MQRSGDCALLVAYIFTMASPSYITAPMSQTVAPQGQQQQQQQQQQYVTALDLAKVTEDNKQHGLALLAAINRLGDQFQGNLQKNEARMDNMEKAMTDSVSALQKQLDVMNSKLQESQNMNQAISLTSSPSAPTTSLGLSSLPGSSVLSQRSGSSSASQNSFQSNNVGREINPRKVLIFGLGPERRSQGQLTAYAQDLLTDER